MERKKRFFRVLLITGIVLAVLGAYALFYVMTGIGIPCMLHEMTGLDCAGCGISRAYISLFRLDLSAAFAYNALWWVFTGYALWVYLACVIPYVREGKLEFIPRPVWLHFAVLAVVAAYGLLRNLPLA